MENTLISVGIPELLEAGWVRKLEGVWWRKTPARTSIVIRKTDGAAIPVAAKLSSDNGWLTPPPAPKRKRKAKVAATP